MPTYEQRLGRPMVFVAYSESRGFVIHWQRRPGDGVGKESVQSPQAPEVFGRILDWLGVLEQGDDEPDAAADQAER